MSVKQSRILEEFQKLVSFDTPSYYEKEIAEYLKNKLRSLGVEVTEDEAGKKLLEEDSSRTETASNIYGYLKGNVSGEPILFSSHLDTVSPGIGKKAIIHQDGRITSEGKTVLGADDVSGIVAILEALEVIREEGIDHPDIEVLFTVAEEPYCSGSRFVEYERLKARSGYVLDLTGPVGIAAISAPSIISLNIQVLGKAAHAGFEPEKGINALNIAVEALAQIKTGRVGKEITVNFGTIKGGSGKNIVPEEVLIEGEIRGFDHEEALRQAGYIKEIFEKTADKYEGEIIFDSVEHIRTYRVSEDEPVVSRFVEAAREVELSAAPTCITTYGGSDANRLNENKIKAIVIACAMESCHSTGEYTTITELERAAELTLKLMTNK